MFSRTKVNVEQYKSLYQDVFGTASGKLVLADMCKKFHMMGPTRAKDDQPGDIEFREGQRNVMLFILAQVDCDLDQLRNNRQQHSLEIIND